MTISIGCKKCGAIAYTKIKVSKKQLIKVKCPFCKESEKIEVGEESEEQK